MKRSVSITACLVLAAALSSPAWAKNGKGGGGGGGGGGNESQAGGLPGLEDRVEADELLITTLQAQVSTLMGEVTTLQGQVATLQTAVADLQGQNNWAVVNADGTIARASSISVVEGDTHVAASGIYEVNFGKDVSKCAYQATLGGTGTAAAPAGEVTVTGDTDV
ncbi:MAG TPA: hypothetical protein VE243_06210, partial [Candidatus Acidoferrum sp.]|nr:hypothetical protein [Candidatus Acidoferrum sp.]